jgi:hypothetical protein
LHVYADINHNNNNNNKMLSNTRRCAFNLRKYFSTKSSVYSKIDDNSKNFIEIKDKTINNGLIRRIVMINDKQRNTLSLEAIKYLQNSIKSIDTDKYRIIILSAGKRHVYSSGHNLKELNDIKVANEVFKEMSNLCALLRNSPLPTIAEVYGKKNISTQTVDII